MQMKEKETLSTSNFVEICLHYKGTNDYTVLRNKVVKRFCTERTFLNWEKGRTAPISKFTANQVSKLVNSVLNLNTTASTLFPTML